MVYDLSKRLGEDLVLGAHLKGNLMTCSIRPAEIISEDPSSPLSRLLLEPKVQVTGSSLIPHDYIGVRDISKAVEPALKKMTGESSDQVSGNPFFVTGFVSSNVQVAQLVAHKMGKKCIRLPFPIEETIRHSFWLKHYALTLIFKDHALGFPMHRLMEIQRFQKTFSNERARVLIGFQPDFPVEQCIDMLIQNQTI
jgi:nucleoside-diphosphate-sugar epimerase